MCPSEETIAAYAAGQLARADRDALDSHLDTCSICQELVAALARVAPSLEGEPAASAIELVAADAESAIIGGTLGRYVLHDRLGAGGMGVVYAAHDPELDRRVAVKVLRRARAGKTLREEARAIAKLAHPNVIAVHDVGEADGEVFVAMEHVEGTDVRAWLRTPRTPAEILDVFVQAGRGIAAAHRAGLIHRDIKPSNIMVGVDGRARVLDFGLARPDDDDDGDVAGTPAYMAPEQKRGERIDARADQYAFAVALSEALGKATVSDRIHAALRRARAESAADRFATMDALLAELVPPPRGVRRWVIATVVVAAALLGTLGYLATREGATPSCDLASAPIDRVWSSETHGAVRAAFVATKLPYAEGAATRVIAQLDAWTARWRTQADATCRATAIDRVQPAATHALRQSCLDELAAQLAPIVALVRAPDAQIIARAMTLATSVPDPERCADIATLGGLPPPPETSRVAVEKLRAEISAYEAALIAGRAEQVRAEILALRERAAATLYQPTIARAQLLVGRLEVSAAHYAEGIAALHAAARAATAARDLETLAETWIELSKALGNDVRSQDEAEVFDGYADALIAKLPDRDTLALELAFARCNRNVTAAQAGAIAAHCEDAIARAQKAMPARPWIVNAARARLGHFQRLQGKTDVALATLRTAVDEAVKVYGTSQHPDVAIAHYGLGIALISQDDFAAGIPELRTSLAIREAVFPGNNVQVAESLIGLGDALGANGVLAESVTTLERGLGMLDALKQGDSAHAANAHILVGMSLDELAATGKTDTHRDAALAHYVRAADIADRTLQHRENIAAMALRSAANVEIARDRIAAALPYLERAVRLLERGKASPLDLGKTQFSLGQVLSELGPTERERARAMIAAARASFVAAGSAATAQLAEVDAFTARMNRSR